MSLRSVTAIVLALCVVSGYVQHAAAQENNQPPEGFKALFNGEDIKGWTGGKTEDPVKIKANLEKMNEAQRKDYYGKINADINKNWSVKDGELISTGKGLHLVTPEDYSDFEMWVDWKLMSVGGDSGIYVRDTPQVQIWDPGHKPAHQHGSDKGSGGLWNNTKHPRDPSQLADNPIGEWNRMYIRIVGQYCTVILNGKTVVDNVVLENFFDRKKPVYASGRIHLQTHGSETRFRNVFVREIGDEEANKILKEIAGDEDSFSSIFNGKDLTGWTGRLDSFDVIDGAIVCKQGLKHNIFTEKKYSDYAVRMEFKLPPAGNSGLALRSPDAKGPDVEVQVLDNTHPRYAKLKPNQLHASLYGVTPAIDGYLRPVGEWNYQEVRVAGGHITVDLNGYRVLDVTLSSIAPNHRAAKLKEGHFGFLGHEDRVAFRDLRIKELGSTQ
ncbi:MAG: DUF1080 domain-containing protein [Planctomycetota bacterium]